MFAVPGHYSPGIEDAMPRMRPPPMHLDQASSEYRSTGSGSTERGRRPLPYPVDDDVGMLPLQRPSIGSRNHSFSSNISTVAQRGSVSSAHGQPATFTSALRDSFNPSHRGSQSSPAAIFYPETPSDQCPSPTLSAFSTPSPQPARPDTTSWLALGDREGRSRLPVRPSIPYRRSESLMVIEEPEEEDKKSSAPAQSPLHTPTQVLSQASPKSAGPMGRASIPLPLVTDVDGVTRAASIEQTPVDTPEQSASPPPPPASTEKSTAGTAIDFGIQANPWSILPVTLTDSYEPRLSANLSHPFTQNYTFSRHDSQLLRRRQERNARRAERSPSPAYSDSDSQGSTATPPSEPESMTGFDLTNETPRGDFLKRFSSSFASHGQTAEEARNQLLAMVEELRSPMEDESDEEADEGALQPPSPTSIYSRPTSFYSVVADSPTLGEDTMDSTIIAGLVPSPLSVVTNAKPSPIFSDNAPASPSSSVSSKDSLRSARPKLSLQTSPSVLQKRARSAGPPRREAETMSEQYARYKAQFSGEGEAPDAKPATPTVDCAPATPTAKPQLHRRFSFESAVSTPTAAARPKPKSQPEQLDVASNQVEMTIVADAVVGEDAEYADLSERNIKRAAWEAARQAAREAEDAEIAAEIAAAAKHQRSISNGSRGSSGSSSSKDKPLPPLPPPKDGIPLSPPLSPPNSGYIMSAVISPRDTIGMPMSAKFEAPRAAPKTPVSTASKAIPPPIIVSQTPSQSSPSAQSPPPPTPPARAANRPVMQGPTRPVTYQPLASIGMPTSPQPQRSVVPPPSPPSSPPSDESDRFTTGRPSPPSTRGASPPRMSRQASGSASANAHIPLPTFADAARYAQPGAGARVRASLQHVKTTPTESETETSGSPPAPSAYYAQKKVNAMAPFEGQAPVSVPRLTKPSGSDGPARPRKTAPVIAATIRSGAADPATRDISEAAESPAQRTQRIQQQIVASYEAKVRASQQQQLKVESPHLASVKDKSGLGKKRSAKFVGLRVFG